MNCEPRQMRGNAMVGDEVTSLYSTANGTGPEGQVRDSSRRLLQRDRPTRSRYFRDRAVSALPPILQNRDNSTVRTIQT